MLCALCICVPTFLPHSLLGGVFLSAVLAKVGEGDWRLSFGHLASVVPEAQSMGPDLQMGAKGLCAALGLTMAGLVTLHLDLILLPSPSRRCLFPRCAARSWGKGGAGNFFLPASVPGTVGSYWLLQLL